jgi:two-component system nitrate/nitrite response regulator NarL
MEDREPRAEESEAILVTTSDAMAPQLSPREKLILRCLIEGDSNKCIARKMDITEATVKVHVKAILRKIRVHNRTQAAIWGMNNGWSRQATDPITPSLPSRTPRQLASAISPVAPIEQNEPPVSAGMIAQANHAELSGFETLIRKDANLKTDITIRSRKQ